MTSPSKAPAKNSIVTLDIEDLAFGGQGLGRIDNFVVFVQGGLPGDRVRARITKRASNHAQAVLVEVERPSPDRIPAPCPLFGTCGGCTCQNLSHDRQLHWKTKQILDTVKRIGSQEPPVPLPMVASPLLWHYRNKMEYSFGLGDEGETILGFHIPGRFDEIFEVPACLIHPKPFDALLSGLTDYARRNGLKGYDQRTHRGFLRHAVMRHSVTTGGVMLALMTTLEGKIPDAEALALELKARCPELQGFIWGINTGLADVAIIQQLRHTWGDPVLKETINGLTFTISPQSFFQTNTLGAELLYQTVVEMAELGEHDTVLDAYCGAGTIGLHCARKVKRVVGIELIREAIWDARANAKANGIANATFLIGGVADGLALAKDAAPGGFTRVIIDPPRGGMDKKSLAGLIAIQAPVFVYVSCNPATLSRDLQTICEGGYVVDAIRPVDMFPHTYHVETVVRLRRKA